MISKSLLIGIAAIGLSASAYAQTAPEPSITVEEFRSHVTFLSDDLLEGREAGTRGHEIAARYVATQFANLGLTAPVNGSWFQEIPFQRYEVTGTPTLSVNGRSFAHGADFVLRASPANGPVEVNAPVVFAGYGLDLPAQGFNDYQGIDARGKVVVVLSGLPEGLPSDVSAHLASEKRRMAAARGAVGLITVQRRSDAERYPFARTAQAGSTPRTTWMDAQGRGYDEGQGLRFTASVSTALSEALFQGARKSLSAVLDEAAVARARPRGFALQHSVAFRNEITGTRFTSPNVLAVLPGSDPALANEYVLLMAHLDGMGVAQATGDGHGHGSSGPDRIRNGAMDNATGVSTLIEVARKLVESGQRPKRPILFAAVTAEEKGLLGAQYLARNPVVNGRIAALVNLDMPILTYDFQDVIAFGAEHSTLNAAVARAAGSMGVRLTPDPLPQEGLFTRSDHYRFVQEGVPAVFLMTGFANGGEERWNGVLRNQYHNVNDDLTLPFNWQAGARFAELNYRILREVADAPQAPRWYRDSLFGQALGGDQPRAERTQAAATQR